MQYIWIWGPPRITFIAILYGASQIIFFTYYMHGSPSDQFWCILYGDSLRLIPSSTIWGPSQISFFVFYLGPIQINFFTYYMGAPLRSTSSLTKWASRSVFSLTIWGPPQINFCAYYVGAPLDKFLHILYGGPSGQFLRLLYIGRPFRSVSSHTIYGPPSDQFVCKLYI